MLSGLGAPRGNTVRAGYVGNPSLAEFDIPSFDQTIAEQGGLYNDKGSLYTSRASAAVTERKGLIFDRLYRPVIERAVDSLDDTSIIENAIGRENTGVARAKERRARELRSYGLQLTGAEQEDLNVRTLANNALGRAQEINTARIAQRQRNENLRNDLVNIGRNIESNSASALSDAADSKARREIAEDQMEAQQKAQAITGVASLGATALIAAAFL